MNTSSKTVLAARNSSDFLIAFEIPGGVYDGSAESIKPGSYSAVSSIEYGLNRSSLCEAGRR